MNLLVCVSEVLFTRCAHAEIYICGAPYCPMNMMLIGYNINVRVNVLVNRIH